MQQRPKLVFLDASVLIAASHSPYGGSALVLEICRGRRFRAAVTIRVLLEARVNIAKKLGEADLIKFYRLIAALDPEMVNAPSAEDIEPNHTLIATKDLHVLAAALQCAAEFLITLDRRHFMTSTIEAASLPLKIMTPGEFLKQVADRMTE